MDVCRLGIELFSDLRSDYIVAATDTIALGLLSATYKMGVAIPADVALSGFGGEDTTRVVYPSITTVSFPYMQAREMTIHLLSKIDQLT